VTVREHYKALPWNGWSRGGNPRNLIVMFAGTGQDKDTSDNGVRTDTLTNIALLWETLAQKGRVAQGSQLVKYFSGIGTEHAKNKPGETPEDSLLWRVVSKVQNAVLDFRDLLAKTTGGGFEESVFRALEWLMDARAKKTDRIAIFGYSRGGHQARLLQGILASYGLPASGSDLEELRANPELLLRWESHVRDDSLAAQRKEHRLPRYLLGLFDACADTQIMGMAIEDLSVGLAPTTENVLHAMALDEMRDMYDVFPLAKHEPIQQEAARGQNIERVWFPGDHSDVGGLHDWDAQDRRFANIPLNWMLERSNALGLLVNDKGEAKLSPKTKREDYAKDVLLTLHDMTGEGLYPKIESAAKYVSALRPLGPVTKTRSPFQCARDSPDYAPPDGELTLHRSVLDRLLLSGEVPRPLCCSPLLLNAVTGEVTSSNVPREELHISIALTKMASSRTARDKYDFIIAPWKGRPIATYHVGVTPEILPVTAIGQPKFLTSRHKAYRITELPTCMSAQVQRGCCVLEHVGTSCDLSDLRRNYTKYDNKKEDIEACAAQKVF